MADAARRNAEIDERLRVVERLTRLFRLERLVYLSFGIAAFVMLLVCIIVALFRQEPSAAIFGAFGSSGIVAFTGGRVIVMWNRALSIVIPSAPSTDGSDK